MEILKNLEEYKELLVKYKPVCRRGYNNNYLSMDMVERYIELQRIYYEAEDNALTFITDEEKYYRAYVQTNPEADITIQKRDKPVLVRNVYKENKKTDVLLKFEDKLKKQGFSIYDESVQIVAKPLEMKEDVQKKYDRAFSFLERAGIKIGYATEENFAEINFLRESEPILKDYHFLYETESEILDNIKSGYFRCAFNMDGKVCAAQQFSVENGTIQGNWLAVQEEYKVRYGIGTAMAYHSFLYAIEHEVQSYFGWVVRDNTKSIKYHQAIGYELTDKFADEWLLA